MSDRITIEPGKRSGQPCIRNLRITVWEILSWLAGGMTEDEILEDYPELEPGDFPSVYAFTTCLSFGAIDQESSGGLEEVGEHSFGFGRQIRFGKSGCH